MISTLPILGKVISLLIAALVAALVIFFFPSCGSTRVVVRNGTEQAQTSIQVTTNNPTSVDASPNVSIDFKGNPSNLTTPDYEKVSY